ncbi:DegV family protein [Acholeplasma equirhinis]|uniref:DegV family protein n=1 Tax=Acholeplasma equirhinis TaxID=555393 RepID=UPI00197AC66E|nr:DegV family protein [Acholeplasma equirhinis]MBN3490960.1 DegV family protein [Acholeplasma equirhinis]
MKKIAIAVTSTSGIDYIDAKKDCLTARLTVTFDRKEYVDYEEITADDFYQMMLAKPDADIHTSQVSTGQFAELYEKVKANGYEELLVITLSSKLSGTYQGAILAKDLVPGLKVEVFDSKSVSYGEAILVDHALRMVKNGASLQEIIKKLEFVRDNTKIYVLVDTLKYLVKNGRLSSTAGLLGTLLKIKPLLKIMEDGSLKPFEKIRTTTKAQQRILEVMLTETKDKDVDFFIAYTTNLDKAEYFKKEIETARPGAKVTLYPLTPVVGAHAGPGTLGMGYSLK